MQKIIAATLCLSMFMTTRGQGPSPSPTGTIHSQAETILPGDRQMNQYLGLLQGKRVAVFANFSATLGGTHLVDTLLKKGIKVVRIFSPEHGFRGNADAGEAVGSYTDSLTGIEVVSLYGNQHLKPTASELSDVDVLVFDIQDVGVRFYTYIASLQYYLEAARDYRKPLILLDRPNPNGFYVDGPVLDPKFASFVGMQPIPVVYGMTQGEYARMLMGEGWLHAPGAPSAIDTGGFRLIVIPCLGYTHHSHYQLPVRPSPNLPNMQSIYLYPSLCFFEGTVVSLGRGTDLPFQCYGHPSFPETGYSFTPHSVPGAKNPPLKDQLCHGYNLGAGSDTQLLQSLDGRLQLKWLLQAYHQYKDTTSFFNHFFTRLAGSEQLEAQMKAGLSEEAIRQSWEPGLKAFKAIRAKYLLYPD
jgi:uncharacterized protein YbbC (DUF1343 family)